MTDKYSIILPTYNERRNLAIITYLLGKVLNEGNFDWELVIVDDNSPDNTQEVAKKLIDIYGKSRIILKTRPQKLGLGTAYMYGIEYCTGNFVIIMDADFSHHPKYIPKFIHLQREKSYDIVLGSRYIAGGGVYGWNVVRKLVSLGANLLSRIVLQHGVSDVTAKKYGYSVGEVPITFIDRLYGESKLGGNEIIGYLKGLWDLLNTL
ncbi:hypothetical protein MERGE_001718 [Pneumocystis wakefieldiae]|uniref:Dolichol-phosphate mannosyltransferase subunit 1 n=1 Tax=Pneumocystis wakefieldiae TaxID=38082 RepID=A0A899G778_9ASCO|nr:hypothetical protein MERGE_001718 [Pneumocystis wakefieldiae]